MHARLPESSAMMVLLPLMRPAMASGFAGAAAGLAPCARKATKQALSTRARRAAQAGRPNGTERRHRTSLPPTSVDSALQSCSFAALEAHVYAQSGLGLLLLRAGAPGLAAGLRPAGSAVRVGAVSILDAVRLQLGATLFRSAVCVGTALLVLALLVLVWEDGAACWFNAPACSAMPGCRGFMVTDWASDGRVAWPPALATK